MGGKFDIKPLIENAVFDTVAGSAFGVRLNTQIEDSEFSQAIKDISNATGDSNDAIGMLLFPSCFSTKLNKYKKIFDTLIEYSKKIIISRLQH